MEQKQNHQPQQQYSVRECSMSVYVHEFMCDGCRILVHYAEMNSGWLFGCMAQ